MINDLRITHTNQATQAIMPEVSIHWKTCLRSIYFHSSPTATHTGTDAYEFLLQVICGLHSPMLGETEILSQFKKFLELNPNAIMPKLSNRLIQDAKKLRTQYLKGYGPQSYGSYTLKSSKDHKKKIIILGAGSLAQEIVPIVKDFPGKVIVKSRNLIKAQATFKRYEQVELQALNQNIPEKDALLVIAAPIESKLLEDMINLQYTNCSILDMRSSHDGPALKLEQAAPYKTLQEIFSDIKETSKMLEATSLKMKREIKELALRWNNQMQIRPFGWEDLCF